MREAALDLADPRYHERIAHERQEQRVALVPGRPGRPVGPMGRYLLEAFERLPAAA